jgi:osmotically-inducible protein OsmY
MTRRFASGLLLATLPVVALAQSSSAPTTTKDEDRIYDEVRRNLAPDSDVRGAGITVDVKGATVTLTGRIRSEKAREKATRLAKKVKGVKDVTNLLKLPDEK